MVLGPSNRNCACKARLDFELGPALRVVSAPVWGRLIACAVYTGDPRRKEPEPSIYHPMLKFGRLDTLAPNHLPSHSHVRFCENASVECVTALLRAGASLDRVYEEHPLSLIHI